VRVLSQADVLGRGDAGMATWLADAEAAYRRVLRSTDRTPAGTVIDYLNTQGKLSAQRPRASRVVWGKGGTYVRAAVIQNDVDEVHGLPVHGFVIDLNQYVVVCASDDEAHYLCAMLNSDAVREGIEAVQTRGQFGARDIHRRPLEVVPIPRFDPANEDHLELARLSREAHDNANQIDFDSQRNRDRYMEAVGDPAARVHPIAGRVLA
jgi:hypothetical protein